MIFPVQHIERWAFDVELLFLAVRFRVPLVEVPVTWQEIEGSKLDAVSATLQMARDMFIIRLCYMLGIWKVTDGAAQAFVVEGKDSSQQRSGAGAASADAAAVKSAAIAPLSPRSPRSRSIGKRVGSQTPPTSRK
jgi:hypothetical protein